jgi:hypothetical protein
MSYGADTQTTDIQQGRQTSNCQRASRRCQQTAKHRQANHIIHRLLPNPTDKVA